MTEKKYNLRETAARLGVHERTVRRRVVNGKLRATTEAPKYGTYRQYFIAESDLAAYEKGIKQPSYGDLAAENTRLHREFLRFFNRVFDGTVNDGDMVRARRALGEGE